MTIEKYNEILFEKIKHIDEDGFEFWYARELQGILEYKEWRKFEKIIKKAMISCYASNYNVLDHFVQVDKMINIAKGANRKIEDFKLSRYACYLIVQNGDSRKKVIALGQSYFAIQTRRQELLKNMSEDERRIEIRNKVRKGNLGLNRTAVECGVKDMARFTNAGYKGLYDGETADDIFKRKKLNYRDDILDYMGSEELSDNLFRITHTTAKLKRDRVDNEYEANSIHYEMGKKIRDFIKSIDGTMPEELPNPISSIKEIDK